MWGVYVINIYIVQSVVQWIEMINCLTQAIKKSTEEAVKKIYAVLLFSVS